MRLPTRKLWPLVALAGWAHAAQAADALPPLALPSVDKTAPPAAAPASAAAPAKTASANPPAAGAAPAIATDNTMTTGLDAPPQIVPIKSLFYTPDETKRIHYAISAYIKRTTGHEQDMALDEINFLKQLTGLQVVKKSEGGLGINSILPPEEAPKKPLVTIYPQFYLAQLAYHSPTDWSVWLNNQRFTQDALRTSDMRVTSITPDHVTFEWKPLDMDLVTAVWDRAPTEDAEVDRLHRTVTFTLKMNQTFTSYAMRVAEGKLPLVPVPRVAPQPTGVAAIPGKINKVIDESFNPETAPTPPPPPSKADDNTGFSGLLNAYKNIK